MTVVSDLAVAHAHSFGLADVLREAPPLLAMLPSQDWAALSSCSKQLRHLVHSSVTAITLPDVMDAAAVLKSSWSQLALIKTQSTTSRDATRDVFRHLKLPQDTNLQLIVSFMSTTNHQLTMTFVVSQRDQASQHKSIAAAFRHSPEWHLSGSLTITIHSCDEEVMTQIAQSAWPDITYLQMRVSKLQCKSVRQLSRASWPKLELLNLSNSQLDDDAMSALIRGNWPLMRRLVLDSNPSLGPAAIALIPTAVNWASLSQLSLAKVKLDTSCSHSIATLHRSLQALNLAFTDMDAAALSQLTALPWPQLQSLEVKGNRLTADGVASLVLAEMPNLRHLNLADNQ